MAELEVIARIYNGFSDKFGIPRQSGLSETLSKIVFEKKYRNPDALRGIEQYSHLWLMWGFKKLGNAEWSPTVRPPRLGGNTRLGVFATRSPNRPNSIGLSSVRLVEVKQNGSDGTVLVVAGADILNGTPIYDIKPYLAYTDSHPEALGGFAEKSAGYRLNVVFPPDLKCKLEESLAEDIVSLLGGDPRPSYQNDPDRVYGMKYGGVDVRFRVHGDTLYVCDVVV